MSYILDSSAIFKAIKENSINKLTNRYTLELARYELGNIIRKQHNLYKTINQKESIQLMRVITDVLNTLEILQIQGKEEKILELAEELETTFYDASYLTYAQEFGIPLLTEDKKLMEKGKRLKITVMNLKNFNILHSPT